MYADGNGAVTFYNFQISWVDIETCQNLTWRYLNSFGLSKTETIDQPNCVVDVFIASDNTTHPAPFVFMLPPQPIDCAILVLKEGDLHLHFCTASEQIADIQHDIQTLTIRLLTITIKVWIIVVCAGKHHLSSFHAIRAWSLFPIAWASGVRVYVQDKGACLGLSLMIFTD